MWHLTPACQERWGQQSQSRPPALSHPKGGHPGLCHKADTGFGLRDLVVWARPPQGEKECGMGAKQRMMDDGHTLQYWAHFERDQLNSQGRGHSHRQQKQSQMLQEKKVRKTEEKCNCWRLEEMQAIGEGQHCTYDVLDQHISPVSHSWMLHDG